MENNKYKISVVIVSYNCDAYIEEAIKSVIAQDGWSLHKIQLIVVNNGSTDQTAQICNTYKSLYAEDIVYIENEDNFGIGKGRNIGQSYAEGEYITFLDADDYWEKGSFKELCSFLDENSAEIDCVFGCVLQCEGRDTYVTPVKYRKTKLIVDLADETSDMPTIINSAVIKTNVAKAISHPENCASCDGLIYIAKAISSKQKYGIIPSAVYYYRIRMDNSNASLNYMKDPRYFREDISVVLPQFIDEMRGHDAGTPEYVQKSLLKEIVSRLKAKSVHKYVDRETLEEYKDNISKVLQVIDDKVIALTKGIVSEYRLYLFKLKYGQNFDENLHIVDDVLCYKEQPLYSLSKRRYVKIELVSIEKDGVVFEGRSGLPGINQDKFSIFFQGSDGVRYPCSNYSKYDYEIISLEEVILKKSGFKFKVPIKNQLKLKAFIEIDNILYPVEYRFGRWAKLSSFQKRGYYKKGNVTIYQRNETIIIDTKRPQAYFELRLARSLIKRKEWDSLLLRRRTSNLRKKKKKQIWLFVDRVNTADENAEFLFKYVNKVKPDYIDTYYVIDEYSKDLDRIKSIGNVVIYGSKQFIDLFLICDEYITSQTTGFILKPTALTTEYENIKDLFPEHFLYLQHGVMEKDMSDSQNKISSNLRMFVTSAPNEYKSLIEYNYGYTEREAVLTGLARHDEVMEYMQRRGKTVIVAPTWRHNLATRVNQKHGGRGYNNAFRDSEFFNFYNNLINDPRILSKMAEKGYKGVLQLHPYMAAQSTDFQLPEVFSFSDSNTSFKERFKDCAILITDYSSVATDYAYLGCPVIYSQFDKDTFYENHTYKAGFFDYEKDGFGPVCYDYESTVESIIKAMDNECVMTEEYLERRNRFFAFFDGRNCERIYNEILRIHQEDLM